MNGLHLWASRFGARWRKWWRDPAAFSDELPLRPLRALMLTGLGGGTLVSDALDPADRAARRSWRDEGVELVKSHHAFEDFRFLTRDGREPQLWPRRVLVEAAEAGVVVVAFMQDGGMMTAAEAGPGRPGLIALGGHPAWCRVYRTDDVAVTPERLMARPEGRAGLVRHWTSRGMAYAEALKAAWPPVERRAAGPPDAAYRAWIARNEPGPEAQAAIGAEVGRLEGAPLISVLMPVHDPQPEHLRAALASVAAQTYPHWRLCVADDGSSSPAVQRLLSEATADTRVRLVRLEPAGGICRATNAAIELAEGEVALFLDHDDALAQHALAEIAGVFAASPQTAAAYSDEDTIDGHGRRSAPLFKPDLDRERLLAQNYVNHAFAVRLDLLRRLGGLKEGLEGVQDHDLVLRVLDSGAGPIAHIPQVLYHWRVFPGGSTFSQSRKAVIDRSRAGLVQRRLDGTGALARPGPSGHVLIERPLPDPAPELTAIIPTRDRPGLLEACVAGLLEQTDYPALRLLIVDNGSRTPRALQVLDKLAASPRIRVLRIDAPFNFAALNNAAARQAGSQLLAFVNDDVMVVEPGWLKAMATLALAPDVGAVGAKLFYPDGRIQHAGIVLGLGPQAVAGHEFRGAPGDSPGPQNRLLVAREASAVTAACMVVERVKFLAVDGFDEEAFGVAFNDVDLCLRLRRAGYRTIFEPQARLMHLESATRGPEKTGAAGGRFGEEVRRMRERWGAELAADPFYNPNLTLQDESFALAQASRVKPGWRRP
jgi:GT2 family glycosyltransferase